MDQNCEKISVDYTSKIEKLFKDDQALICLAVLVYFMLVV